MFDYSTKLISNDNTQWNVFGGHLLFSVFHVMNVQFSRIKDCLTINRDIFFFAMT